MLTPPQLEDNAPWKERVRAPALFAPQVAPLAPDRGLVGSNRSGTVQWYAWDLPTGELRQLTDTPGGHANFPILSPDGRWVYYLQDSSGNEIGHYVRIPYDGGEPQDLTPDLPLYSSWTLTCSRAGNRLGFTAADAEGFHVYCADVKPDGTLGERRKIYHSSQMIGGLRLSHDGDVAVIMSTERTGKPQYCLLSFNVETGQQLAELWDGDENSLFLAEASPLPGAARFLALSTRTGFERPLIWDARTGERQDLAVSELSGAVMVFDWSADGEEILLHTLDQAQQQLYIYRQSDQTIMPLQSPPGSVNSAYFRPDSSEILIDWNTAAQPNRIIALDVQTGAVTRTVLAAGEVPPGHPWRSVTFPSSDGQMIQAWLALPEGEGPFPLVLSTHGGPAAVARDGFAPGAQMWLDHGFAFISVNYRGSTTFGRDFEQQIWGRPGELELEDMVAARNWLVAEGIADPGAILLTGGSYGGYLTLLGLGRRPDLWAGGMATVPIADWAAMYEDESESLRGYHKALFGGTPDETPEQHRISSPITYVENVQAPVLILQGRNDTRTPARPVEQYEARMRSLGKEIQVHWYDTGHAGSSTSVDERILQQELMLRFAYRVLG
jgi:Tol biopolymer transport system component/dienelactone hydrolase